MWYLVVVYPNIPSVWFGPMLHGEAVALRGPPGRPPGRLGNVAVVHHAGRVAKAIPW